jgi:16S rRNA (guanine527-N7)-methyltransferase
VTEAALPVRIRRRATTAGLPLTGGQIEDLSAYCVLLERWNRRMNLTALPLRDFPDPSLDRLLLEPLGAARYLDASSGCWLDLGSGGGSPAIPIKLARPRLRLTMVESRSRKAAFLREVVRTLALTEAAVFEGRIEDLPEKWEGLVDLLTVRAVRADAPLMQTASAVLRRGGRLLVFGAPPSENRELRLRETVALPGTTTALHIVEKA